MKTLVKIFVCLVLVTASTWLFPKQTSAQNNPVSLQVFYDELSPYGTWIEDQEYGYVWIPRVDEDFSPYVTNGHWINTDYGWTWVSDYPWGWAPFHYGRWFVDPMYGDVWIPDTEWGPAWVTWRQANGYIGWTPMGPGIDINIALRNSYNVPRDRWVFVRDRDFIQYDLNRYCLERSMNYNIFNISLMIRNTRYDNDRHSTYFYGPRRDDVQRYAGRVINPVHIRDYDRPGQSYNRDYLNIYRPQVRRDNVYGQMPVPRSINRNTNSREEANRNRDNSNQNNRNPYYQDRKSQQGQQPNGSSQPTPQTNVNSSGNQREQQPSRNQNTYYNPGRSSQPVQQQNANPSRNQGVQQPSRNENTYYQGRNSQPVQQPTVNQPRNQREVGPVQNSKSSESSSPRTIVNVRQEKAIMVAQPEKDKKDESNKNSEVHQPRR